MDDKKRNTYNESVVSNQSVSRAELFKEEVGIDVGFMGSREESADARTIASRNRLRDQMGGEVEAFLSHGGKIAHIAPHVTADPPQKPTNHYGRRPL